MYVTGIYNNLNLKVINICNINVSEIVFILPLVLHCIFNRNYLII